MNRATVRRLLHASSASALFFHIFGSPGLMRVVLMGCAALAVLLDSLRLTMPTFGASITRLVPVFRATESTRLSGATWLCVGYALASWFPYPAMAAGILTGAFADPAASWAGATVGKLSTGKTWAGSAAAAVMAAMVILALGLPWVVVASGAVAAMALERWSSPLNDNLVVAPGVAFIVWLIL